MVLRKGLLFWRLDPEGTVLIVHSTTILKKRECGLDKEYIMLHIKVIFYLLQDGCSFKSFPVCFHQRSTLVSARIGGVGLCLQAWALLLALERWCK